MIVHLIDGTYELFRHFYGIRRMKKGDPPFGAVRGVLQMVLQMIETGATHIGVATDHVIESFRNELWDGYKTGAGIDAALWAQFHPLEEALTAMGVVVWPMVDLEADDALASAAALAAANPAVEKVCIWTPDKDLAQCVVAGRVVQVDRKSGKVRDVDGVREKFGVAPKSIPDYLALVGDAADGYPGLAGFGAKSAAAVLARFEHIEAIPANGDEWRANVAGSGRLAATLREQRELALLFRTLATLRDDAELFDDVDALRWRGPTKYFAAYAQRMGALDLVERATRTATRQSDPSARP
ncbi:MAG TPA: 5'-3' exonuclease H3TH domain-containing protein [Thermoanaerobaculia bacterium]|nr:5'-3' exonuclease H3TH domain-containing protein [Thermoanaerobaculia bacterium]